MTLRNSPRPADLAEPPWRLSCRRAALATIAVVGLAGALPARAESLADTYRARATQLTSAALADTDGYANLAYLCDHIGKRISGSEPLERAIAWSADLMQREGLANVRLQPVMVPKWVRGDESGAIVAPVTKPLHLLGLGMSVGTPAGGITADALVVRSMAELQALGRDKVAGRIVVFDVPYAGYGTTVRVRVGGASLAASLGAVGVLVRSITPLAMQTPHTGTLRYDPSVPKIPAAAITPEDAAMLTRLAAEKAPVRVHLDMQAHQEPDASSANVIGEIVGSELPDDVVVLGGHIDSWDVGQGAQDDGSGIMAALEAVHLMRRLGLKPRRTVRVVFWVNEENGGAGGKAYRLALTREALNHHVAAIEMDGGAEAPVGFGYGFSGSAPRPVASADGASAPVLILPDEQPSFDLLHDIATLLAPIGADTIRPGGFGSDIEPLMQDGVASLGEFTTMAHYFDWHHTEADTLDKVDPADFRKNVAALAVMAYVLADMPGTLAGHVHGSH